MGLRLLLLAFKAMTNGEGRPFEISGDYQQTRRSNAPATAVFIGGIRARANNPKGRKEGDVKNDENSYYNSINRGYTQTTEEGPDIRKLRYLSRSPRSREGGSQAYTPVFGRGSTTNSVPQSDPRHYRNFRDPEDGEPSTRGEPDLRAYVGNARSPIATPPRATWRERVSTLGSSIDASLSVPAKHSRSKVYEATLEARALIESLEAGPYDKLKSRLSERENVLQSALREVELLKEKIASQQVEIGNLRLRLTTVRKDKQKLQGQNETLRHKLKDNSMKYDEIRKKNKNLEDNKTDLTHDLESLSTREKTNHDRLEAVELSNRRLNFRVRELEGEHETKDEEIKGLRSRISELSSQLREVEVKRLHLGRNDSRSDRLKGDLNDMYKQTVTQKENHRRAIDSLKKENQQKQTLLMRDLQELKTENNKLKEAVSSSSTIDQTKHTVDELNRKFDRHIDLAKKLKFVGGDVDIDAREESTKLHAQLEQMRELFMDAKKEVEEKHNECGKVKGQLFQMMEQLKMARKERDVTRGERDKLHNDVVVLKAEIDSKKDDNLAAFVRSTTESEVSSESQEKIIVFLKQLLTSFSKMEKAVTRKQDELAEQVEVNTKIVEANAKGGRKKTISTEEKSPSELEETLNTIRKQIKFLGGKLIPFFDDVKRDIPDTVKDVLKKHMPNPATTDDVSNIEELIDSSFKTFRRDLHAIHETGKDTPMAVEGALTSVLKKHYRNPVTGDDIVQIQQLLDTHFKKLRREIIAVRMDGKAVDIRPVSPVSMPTDTNQDVMDELQRMRIAMDRMKGQPKPEEVTNLELKRELQSLRQELKKLGASREYHQLDI
eukprot:1182804-Amorphochlora_amoeboformis.AAC.2